MILHFAMYTSKVGGGGREGREKRARCTSEAQAVQRGARAAAPPPPKPCKLIFIKKYLQ